MEPIANNPRINTTLLIDSIGKIAQDTSIPGNATLSWDGEKIYKRGVLGHIGAGIARITRSDYDASFREALNALKERVIGETPLELRSATLHVLEPALENLARVGHGAIKKDHVIPLWEALRPREEVGGKPLARALATGIDPKQRMLPIPPKPTAEKLERKD